MSILPGELRFLGVILLIPVLWIWACGAPPVRRAPAPPPRASIPVPQVKKGLPRLGYTIQAGAFAKVENAARFAGALKEKGLESTYFVARRGLFKVRIGNFPTRERARAEAEELRREGMIEEFYVVRPEEYAVAQRESRGEAFLRGELVRTALSFVGVPYLWGGNSPETGFDCSGLTMTVYQLNGLDLPRTAREQFATGFPVDRSSMEQGDLLFFAAGGDKVSHVGIYCGKGLFVHAPGQGKAIRTEPLEKGYFDRAYIGARSYL